MCIYSFHVFSCNFINNINCKLNIIELLFLCIHSYNNNNTLHTMKYINSLRQDTSGEDGCGVGSHQVKVQPAVNVT